MGHKSNALKVDWDNPESVARHHRVLDGEIETLQKRNPQDPDLPDMKLRRLNSRDRMRDLGCLSTA